LIDDGKVQVNGVVCTKAGYKLRPLDEVAVDFNEAELSEIPDIELEILYEDNDCVVINKPVGLLTHSKGAFNPEATVATWLRTHCARSNLSHKANRGEGDENDVRGLTFHNQRAGIVHRLDRATSGVMICAKTPGALSWLQKQFAQRKTKKTYHAVVLGAMQHPDAVIDMPIERNPKAPATFRVGTQGKYAKTTYHTLRHKNDYSLLELKPETGRTHQLRVHLDHQGHPIVGDTLYAGEPAERLFLHAAELELTLLAGHERKVFQAPTPPEFYDKVG